MNEDKPRIAFYIRFLYGGGAERVIINLIKSLNERGIEIDLVLNNVGGPFIGEIPSKVRIINLKATRLLLGLPKLVNYLKQTRPMALLSAMHYTNEIAIVAKHLAGVPTKVIVSEHNTLSVYARQQKSNERWSLFTARLLYPRADRIVTVSRGAAEDLATITGLSGNHIQMIYNPVITPELIEKSKEPIEHPWLQSEETPVILGVGRLSEQKDFSTLIRAFAHVRSVKPARLMILGRGPQKPKLYALVKELGLEQDVALPGFVDNPSAYMAKASVLVLSSAWEGLPTVLIEAMAVGTPVVATNCPNGPAEILDNGKYGELVSVGDGEALAQAILKVLSGESKTVDKTWLEQFTLETATRKYAEILSLPLSPISSQRKSLTHE